MTVNTELAVTTTGGWARPGWWDVVEARGGRRALRARRRAASSTTTTAAWRSPTRSAAGSTSSPTASTAGAAGSRTSPPRCRAWSCSRAPRRLGALGYDMLDVWKVTRAARRARVDVGLRRRVPLPARSHRPAAARRHARALRDDHRAGLPRRLPVAQGVRGGARPGAARAHPRAARRRLRLHPARGADHAGRRRRRPEPGVDGRDRSTRWSTASTAARSRCTSASARSAACPTPSAPTDGCSRRLLDANVHGFSLEFGGREMAEIDLVGQWDPGRILSAGLIDIKTHYAETPADIVERVRTCLQYRQARRAWRSPPTAGCGACRATWRWRR